MRSVTKTVRTLWYPTKRIHDECKQEKQRKVIELINTKTHPRNPSVEVKMDALHRCFKLGESIKSVSQDIGYTRASIYAWRKKYLKKGAVALMNKKNIKPETLKEGSVAFNTEVEN
ncbi:Homeodomain-like domain-containing protein [Clostridium acidisoli DSM 12555]|uniref:Homeodomain-like domain-containing protein n=1 Tax=Clostridium acidisoli DSM 12555 TaxID=1121291 RepID=A0A1W1XHE7_9CLOT|nr:transposase [Clostridium acidisoli]SMC23415.1 Homeodomain-like domain-containing protein [Clostridium acidisoli DSM 12555]